MTFLKKGQKSTAMEHWQLQSCSKVVLKSKTIFLIQAENQSNQEALGIIKINFQRRYVIEINKLQDKALS